MRVHMCTCMCVCVCVMCIMPFTGVQRRKILQKGKIINIQTVYKRGREGERESKKVKVRGRGSGKGRGEGGRSERKVLFSTFLFLFPCKLYYSQLGFVRVNLAEFAGAGVVQRKYLLESYNEHKHKPDNSILRIKVMLKQTSGDVLFKA